MCVCMYISVCVHEYMCVCVCVCIGNVAEKSKPYIIGGKSL